DRDQQLGRPFRPKQHERGDHTRRRPEVRPQAGVLRQPGPGRDEAVVAAAGQVFLRSHPEGSALLRAAGARGRAAATYFDNPDFTGTTVTRTDATVQFDWGTGSPAPGIGPDTFSARWTGQVLATATGTYTFRTNSDDGVRVWVNGQLIIDHWTDHGPTFDTGTITLTAGLRYEIVIEYHDTTGIAVVALDWMRPGSTGFEAIPQANLFSST